MHRRTAFGVAALAAATLLLETTLTRLLAVAQFYHFAFLVVSLALLGFGASGTLLTLVPRLVQIAPERLLAGAGAAFVVTAFVAYLAVNLLPLDSYSIAWDRRQILYFVLYYLVLAGPFLCAGIGIGAALAAGEGRSHLTYAANMSGSALGVLLAPAALSLAGVPGAVLAACLVALLPVLSYTWRAPRARWGGIAAGLLLVATLIALGSLNLQGRAVLGLTLSPYKGLVYAWRYPGSITLFSRWNALARVDVVGDAGTRQLPGLSYTYGGPAPRQVGLSLDADTVQPVPLAAPDSFEAGAFMPEAIAFALRPGARVLAIEPGGGLGVLQALSGGAGHVTAVIGNELIVQGIESAGLERNIYADPRVRVVTGPVRSLLKRDAGQYDVVFVPLTDTYRPVASGAYSLAETYNLTEGAVAAALARVAPDGIMVMTRWVQTPPSEDLRFLATVHQALSRSGLPQIERALVAYRGIQTVTALVRPGGWSDAELARIRAFAEERRFDLVWAPDVREDEVNRFNRMPSPDLYRQFAALQQEPTGVYASYPFAVEPARDDKPFFFHFFRWGQTREVLATLGRTWQPFGGSGYLVLFALLALVTLLGALLIIAPLLLRRTDVADQSSGRGRVRALAYFGLLGIAFLLVEIPLIQRWMLVAGHATYAFTGVVLVVLLGSSVGSLLSRRVWPRRRLAVAALTLLTVVVAVLSPRVAEAVLAWPSTLQWAALAIMLFPLAVFMGMPFPLGLAWVEQELPGLAPWAWAVNGCASVIASVVAAILTISAGITVVLVLGAATYGLAAIALPANAVPSAAQR